MRQLEGTRVDGSVRSEAPRRCTCHGAPPSRPMLQRLIYVGGPEISIRHDNPYSMLGDPSAASVSFSAPEVAVELGSMSKSHNMAGWRIGWISGRRDDVGTLFFGSRPTSNRDCVLPLQHAPAGHHVVPDRDERSRSEYARRLEGGHGHAGGAGCTVDPGQAGMFVLARIPDEVADAISFSDHLLQTHHLFITPGSILAHAGIYMRLSLCSSLETLSRCPGRRLERRDCSLQLHSRGAS